MCGRDLERGLYVGGVTVSTVKSQVCVGEVK